MQPNRVIFITCFLFCINSLSQNVDTFNKYIEQNCFFIENTYDNINNDEEKLSEDLFKEMLYFKENPVDINIATEDELKRIVFLTHSQVSSIIEYRKKYGYIKTLNELYYIDGFDEHIVKLISPFIKISNNLDEKKHTIFNIDIFSSVIFNNDFHFVYRDSSWESSFFKNTLLFKMNSKYLNLCLKGDKDGGEAFFKKSNKQGYDFYSGYLEIKPDKILKKVIIGDYQLKVGQGLTIWNGYDLNKSIYNIELKKYEKNLISYNGINEYDFFRGIAIESNYRNFQSIGFISKNYLDAYIENDTNKNYITSFIFTGLHRNNNEIKNEKNVEIVTCGTRLKYYYSIFQIGMSFVNYYFDKSYIPDYKTYNFFLFRGNSLQKIGFDFILNTKMFDFFCEFSENNNKISYLIGFTKSYYDAILSILIRDYAPGFNTLFANPISEYKKFDNEKGFIFGFKFNIRNIKISGYSDIYFSRWLRYKINSPSYGKDISLQMDYAISEKNLLNIKLSSSNKCSIYSLTEDRIPVNNYVNTHSIKINVSSSFNENLEIKNSFLYNRFLSKVYFVKNIFIFSNTFNFKIGDRDNKLITGCIYYYINNYNLKYYYYEPMLYLNSGFEVFSGKGIKLFFIYKMKSIRPWKLYLKYSQSPSYKYSMHLIEFLLSCTF